MFNFLASLYKNTGRAIAVNTELASALALPMLKFLVRVFSSPEPKAHKVSLGERGGSVVECRTREREVRGSRPTAAVLCP